MSTRYGLGGIVPEEGHTFEKKRNVSTASTTDETATVTPASYKLDARGWRRGTKNDPNPILGPRYSSYS